MNERGEVVIGDEPRRETDVRQKFEEKAREWLAGVKPEVKNNKDEVANELVQTTIRKLVVPNSVLGEMHEDLRQFAEEHQQGTMALELLLLVNQAEILVAYRDKRDWDALTKTGIEIVTILDGKKSREYAVLERSLKVSLISPVVDLNPDEDFSWKYTLRSPNSKAQYPTIVTEHMLLYEHSGSLRYAGSHSSGGAQDRDFASFVHLLNNARIPRKQIGSRENLS